MYQIEVGGKLYLVDTSQVTIGDWIKACEDMNSEDQTRKSFAFNWIMVKSLGDQIYGISIHNWSYVLGKVIEIMLAPLSSSAVDDEVREILEMSEDEDKGV